MVLMDLSPFNSKPFDDDILLIIYFFNKRVIIYIYSSIL